jgi:transcriptional regulator
MQPDQDRLDLLQGTLDMLILQTLVFGPRHGQAIAHAIQSTSQGELLVEHGSLYPALQRLLAKKWVEAEWGVSENNRKARFYRLTDLGREHLAAESSRWSRLTTAIARIMNPNPQNASPLNGMSPFSPIIEAAASVQGGKGSRGC